MEVSPYNVTIKSNSSSYVVQELESYVQFHFHEYDLVVIDTCVFDNHELKINCPIIKIDASESAKEYHNLSPIFDALIKLRINRNSKVLALGGGVVQDIVTFVSSLYFRGISWDFMPTTLLAMGDSCIGGKSSINFRNTKNVIGNFHPPKRIFLCVEFLASLNEVNLKSGIGELYHYAFLRKREDFDWYNKILDKGFNQLSLEDYRKLIWKTLNIKKEIIEEDEFDTGRRLFNNWGHTIGHALEAITDFAIPHGQAVLTGIFFELKLLELLNNKNYDKFTSVVQEFITEYGYNETLSFNPEHLFEIIKKDKKNIKGQIVTVNLLEIEQLKLSFIDELQYHSLLKSIIQ